MNDIASPVSIDGPYRLQKLGIDTPLRIDTEDGATYELTPTTHRIVSWSAIHGVNVVKVVEGQENITITEGSVGEWSILPVVLEVGTVVTIRKSGGNPSHPKTFKIIRMYFLPS